MLISHAMLIIEVTNICEGFLSKLKEPGDQLMWYDVTIKRRQMLMPEQICITLKIP